MIINIKNSIYTWFKIMTKIVIKDIIKKTLNNLYNI